MRWSSVVLVLLVVGAVVVWRTSPRSTPPARENLVADDGSAPAAFKCEGKQRCAEMVSCEEAMFYLQNCPGVKMDGDGDGIPCESQWCGSR